METLARSLQGMGHSLLDYAYPPHCAVCGAHIEAAALLCAECWLAIEKAKRTKASVNIAEPELIDFKLIKNIILGKFSVVLQEAIYTLISQPTGIGASGKFGGGRLFATGALASRSNEGTGL